MDDPQSKRSLADDPKFLAILSGLEPWLVGGEEAIEEALGSVPPPQASPPAPPSGPPASLRPVTSQRPVPIASPPLPALQPSPSPVPADRRTEPAARRPLLDLFPPPPAVRDAAPMPAFGGAAPHLARNRPLRSIAAPEAVVALSYETFYGLAENPFTISADPKFVYHSEAYDRAAEELLDAIARREGVAILTGGVGTGKTTLCRAVIDQLDRRTFTSLVSDPSLSVDDLLKTVLVDFGVISREDLTGGHLASATRAKLMATLKDFLGSLATLQASAVVIVDDAHTLPVEVLEQVRVLPDMAGAERLQVVLVGSRDLLTVVNRRELRELNRHITMRIALGTLVADEIPGYVMRRLAVAGASARVEFDDRAFARLFALSSGVPRVVNLLCDGALTLGHKASASIIDASLIEDAAENLELGPRTATSRRLLQAVAFVFILATLMAAGGAAAVWTFRDQASATLDRWAAIPTTPQPPIRRAPVPLAPIPPPEDGGLER